MEAFIRQVMERLNQYLKENQTYIQRILADALFV